MHAQTLTSIYTPVYYNSYFAVGSTFAGKHWNSSSVSYIEVVKGPVLVKILPRNKPTGDVQMNRDLL